MGRKSPTVYFILSLLAVAVSAILGLAQPTVQDATAWPAPAAAQSLLRFGPGSNVGLALCDDVDTPGCAAMYEDCLGSGESLGAVSTEEHIALRETGFDPPVAIVLLGEEVVWTNLGGAGHTVTAGTSSGHLPGWGDTVFLPVLLKHAPDAPQLEPQPVSLQVDAPLFDSGPMMVGQRFSYTFASAGVFTYCSVLSPTVVAGTIQVVEAETVVTRTVDAGVGGNACSSTGLCVSYDGGAILTDTIITLASSSSLPSTMIENPVGNSQSIDLTWPAALTGTITVYLPYDETDVPPDTAESELTAFFFNGLDWIAMPATVDTTANRVAVTTPYLAWWEVGVLCSPFDGAYDDAAQIAYDRGRDYLKTLADHQEYFDALRIAEENIFEIHADQARWLAGQRMCDLDDLTPAIVEANLGVALTPQQAADVLVCLGQDLMAQGSDSQHIERLCSELSDTLNLINLNSEVIDAVNVSNLAQNFLLGIALKPYRGLAFDIDYALEVQGDYSSFQEWVNDASPEGFSNLVQRSGVEVFGDDEGCTVVPCQHLFDRDSQFYFTTQVYGSYTYANLYQLDGSIDFVLGLQEMDRFEADHWAPPLFRDRLDALILVVYEVPGENQVGAKKKAVRMLLENEEIGDACLFSRVQLPDARLGTLIEVNYHLIDDAGHLPFAKPPVSWTETTTFCYGSCTAPNASAPNTPGMPSPADGAVGQLLDVTLSWIGGDPDGNPVTYDIYLAAGGSTPDTLVEHGLSSAGFNPAPLAANTEFSWRVVSYDTFGAQTAGPTWHFTTGAGPNHSPTIPSSPSPADGALGQLLDADLSWTGGDPDGDIVTYTVYFEMGDTTPDVLASSGQTSTMFDPGQLVANEDYYWQIIAVDDEGAVTPGPVWGFSTLLTGDWEEVGTYSAGEGGISDNCGDSMLPVAVANSGETLYVFWLDDDSGAWQVFGKRWNGSTWDEISYGSAHGGGISNMSGNLSPFGNDYVSVGAAIATDGMLYVAWANDSSGDAEIYVKKWDGSGWSEVGAESASGTGISDNAGESTQPSLATAPDGMLYVAWFDYSDGDTEIYVKRWNGYEWSEVGAGSASGGGVSNNSGSSMHPKLAISVDGTPYLVWADTSSGNWEIYVRIWDGSDWTEVGSHSATGQGISNNSDMSTAPSIAIDSLGIPYVAWSDLSGSTAPATYIRRWNGSFWEEVGSGSASSMGLCDEYFSTALSTDPNVTVDTEGRPYVTWSRSTGQYTDVFLRRWTGIGWEGVFGGSSSDYGISGTPSSFSEHPRLTISGNGAPVLVWEDDGNGDFEIYLLRWSD